MKYAVCPISVVPVRSSTANKSEQVTQLLFGEMVEILETKGKQWLKIRCLHDNCIGWVLTRQLELITPVEYDSYRQQYAFSLDLLHPVMADGYSLPIPIGAKLPCFDGIRFSLAGQSFTFSGQAVFPQDILTNTDVLLKIARRYLFAPELSGGRSPLGVDAAGFTQLVFGFVGITLYRDATQQVFQGETINFVEESQAGDLAFFENKKGNIQHVGIVMPEQQIIHCAGRVRLDTLDHYGIFNQDEKRYTHKLRIIRRMLEKQHTSLPLAPLQNETPSSQIRLFS